MFYRIRISSYSEDPCEKHCDVMSMKAVLIIINATEMSSIQFSSGCCSRQVIQADSCVSQVVVSIVTVKIGMTLITGNLLHLDSFNIVLSN